MYANAPYQQQNIGAPTVQTTELPPTGAPEAPSPKKRGRKPKPPPEPQYDEFGNLIEPPKKRQRSPRKKKSADGSEGAMSASASFDSSIAPLEAPTDNAVPLTVHTGSTDAAPAGALSSGARTASASSHHSAQPQQLSPVSTSATTMPMHMPATTMTVTDISPLQAMQSMATMHSPTIVDAKPVANMFDLKSPEPPVAQSTDASVSTAGVETVAEQRTASAAGSLPESKVNSDTPVPAEEAIAQLAEEPVPMEVKPSESMSLLDLPINANISEPAVREETRAKRGRGGGRGRGRGRGRASAQPMQAATEAELDAAIGDADAPTPPAYADTTGDVAYTPKAKGSSKFALSKSKQRKITKSRKRKLSYTGEGSEEHDYSEDEGKPQPKKRGRGKQKKKVVVEEDSQQEEAVPMPTEPEDYLEKRRSGRVTKRKKYTEPEMHDELGTDSDEEPPKGRRGASADDTADDSQNNDAIRIGTLIDENQMVVEKILATRKRPPPGTEHHHHKSIGEDEEVERHHKESAAADGDQDSWPDEYYVKFRGFSYMHCVWKTSEELEEGDKRVSNKIKRFWQKREQAITFLDEQYD